MFSIAPCRRYILVHALVLLRDCPKERAQSHARQGLPLAGASRRTLKARGLSGSVSGSHSDILMLGVLEERRADWPSADVAPGSRGCPAKHGSLLTGVGCPERLGLCHCQLSFYVEQDSQWNSPLPAHRTQPSTGPVPSGGLTSPFLSSHHVPSAVFPSSRTPDSDLPLKCGARPDLSSCTQMPVHRARFALQ